MIEEKIIIENLSDIKADIIWKKFFIDESGTLTQLGENHRNSYNNTASGRLELAELPQNVQDSILAIWGTAPTIEKNQSI